MSNVYSKRALFEQFAQGHIAGAVNIPIDELGRRFGELDEGREIVVYCRGPYCIMSFDPVASLRDGGFTMRRLEDGYPEWRAAGLPIA